MVRFWLINLCYQMLSLLKNQAMKINIKKGEALVGIKR